jgi:PAS domain S-box-containing protein
MLSLPVEVKRISGAETLKDQIREQKISLLVLFPGSEIPSLEGLEKHPLPVLLVGDPDIPEGSIPDNFQIKHLSPDDGEDFLFMISLMSPPEAQAPDQYDPDYGLLKKIFSSAEELILVTQGDYVVFFNERITRFFSRDAEYIRTHPFWEFIHPDDWDLVREMRTKRLSGQIDNIPYKFRVVNHKGQEIWMQNTGYRIDWQGKPATLNFLVFIGKQIEAETRVRNVEAFLQDIIEYSP